MAGERREGRRLAITWILIDAAVVVVVAATIIALFLWKAVSGGPLGP
jgi:hypothetical protein